MTMWENIGKLGIVGFIAIAVVLTVCGLAVWSVTHGASEQVTTALVTVLVQGAAVLFAAAGKMFGGNGGGNT